MPGAAECRGTATGEVVYALGKRAIAEFLGTFWLVLGGCVSAILAAASPNLGIGFVWVGLASGLTVFTMAYAIGTCRAAI